VGWPRLREPGPRLAAGLAVGRHRTAQPRRGRAAAGRLMGRCQWPRTGHWQRRPPGRGSCRRAISA